MVTVGVSGDNGGEEMAGFSTAVRKQVQDRAAMRCEICGLTKYGMQIHHRRPRGMGGSGGSGTNQANNALLLCVHCHRMVESQREFGYRRGWLVEAEADPAMVPVLRWNGWYLFPAEPEVGMRPLGEDDWVPFDSRDARNWQVVEPTVVVDPLADGLPVHADHVGDAVQGDPAGPHLVGDPLPVAAEHLGGSLVQDQDRAEPQHRVGLAEDDVSGVSDDGPEVSL